MRLTPKKVSAAFVYREPWGKCVWLRRIVQDDVLFRSMGFVKRIEAPGRNMHPCIRMHAVVAEFVEVFALAQAGELRGRRKAILALKPYRRGAFEAIYNL